MKNENLKNSNVREISVDNKFFDITTVARASKYIILTGDDNTDFNSIMMLDILRKNIDRGVSNDIAKYNMPECYKTELTWTINSRSLKNFLSLRTGKSALKEIRELAYEIFDKIPDDHKYL